jgi:hypothetical protein
VIVSGKPSGCWPTCGFTNTFTADIFAGMRTDAGGIEILPGNLTRQNYIDGVSFDFALLDVEKDNIFEAGALDAAYYLSLK